MIEPVTIWKRDDIANVYTHPASWPTTRAVHFLWADGMRKAKHLTDAELAAEHFSWCFLASHTAFEDGGWSRDAEAYSKRAQTIRRFATHDQAV
ncbi:hypothetical protein SAMN04489745_3115 [Arthrobacter woluwensis]|uniref:Uncharacterized protein n=2 Tax=Arthrobacter woluwensis TaxID=156980 RepID=A0A1H4TAL7_9MICC|nr:hypothetical protein SAMN04489745_0038 [Arthrobacter woluwensis]SEC53506.1 hypothetical protein SAMN04489745_3115 [Arthrobacter woluwensis]